MFFCEYCEISTNTFSYRTPLVAASKETCTIGQFYFQIVFVSNIFSRFRKWNLILMKLYYLKLQVVLSPPEFLLSANSFIYNKKSYNIYFLSSVSLISVFFSTLLWLLQRTGKQWNYGIFLAKMNIILVLEFANLCLRLKSERK